WFGPVIGTVVFYCSLSRESATPELVTLSLHDALPISMRNSSSRARGGAGRSSLEHAQHPPAEARARRPGRAAPGSDQAGALAPRSEEHTSELQSRGHLVCRLLPEKKKNK